MTSPNANWPVTLVEADLTQGPPNLVGSSRVSLNSAARRTAVRQVEVRRGRQYELDQTQAGTATITITDPLEVLNPGNTGSALMTGGNTLKAYRCLRIAALWPNSGNIVNSGVQAGFDPSFETGTGGVVAAGGTTLASSTSQHFDGTHSLLVTQGSAASGAWPSLSVPTAPGLQYTFSIYARPNTSVSVQVQSTVGNSAVDSTTGAWTRLSVTFTAVDAVTKFTVAGTGTSTPTYFLDAAQLEYGATASTFDTTGPTLYPLFTGYIERYPLQYDMAGTRGVRPLTAVDALAVLSRTQISQSYQATQTASSPFLYALLNESGPPGFLHSSMVGTYAYTANLASGSNVGWGGDQFLDGTSCLTSSTDTAANPAYPAAFMPPYTFWMDPAAFSFDLWMLCVFDGIGANLWCTDPTGTVLGGWSVSYFADTTSGALSITVKYLPVSGAATVWVVPATPGAWHHVAVSCSGGNATLYVDNVSQGAQSLVGGAVYCSSVVHGAQTTMDHVASKLSVFGLGLYNRAISSTEVNTHYQRGVGYSGELSGTRVSRLLTQYWGGATSVAAGYLKIAADYSYNTRFVLDVLQEIQESERGLVYVSAAGTVVFEDRVSRYSNQAALWVFGENPAGASPVEYPYSDYAGDFDPTYVFSQCDLSRPGNNQFAPVTNSSAQADYGQRVLTQTVQCLTDFDLAQAATFYLARYAAPKTRVEKLVLRPSANPALWPVVLSLEISQRVTVKRRTQALTTSGDYYIEQVNHRITADSGEWTVELQLSPVFVPSAWILGDSTYGVLGTTTVPVY